MSSNIIWMILKSKKQVTSRAFLSMSCFFYTLHYIANTTQWDYGLCHGIRRRQPSNDFSFSSLKITKTESFGTRTLVFNEDSLIRSFGSCDELINNAEATNWIFNFLFQAEIFKIWYGMRLFNIILLLFCFLKALKTCMLNYLPNPFQDMNLNPTQNLSLRINSLSTF